MSGFKDLYFLTPQAAEHAWIVSSLERDRNLGVRSAEGYYPIDEKPKRENFENVLKAFGRSSAECPTVETLVWITEHYSRDPQYARHVAYVSKLVALEKRGLQVVAEAGNDLFVVGRHRQLSEVQYATVCFLDRVAMSKPSGGGILCSELAGLQDALQGLQVPDYVRCTVEAAERAAWSIASYNRSGLEIACLAQLIARMLAAADWGHRVEADAWAFAWRKWKEITA